MASAVATAVAAQAASAMPHSRSGGGRAHGIAANPLRGSGHCQSLAPLTLLPSRAYLRGGIVFRPRRATLHQGYSSPANQVLAVIHSFPEPPQPLLT